MSVLQLNCENLSCPMPIVELTKATRQLKPGDCIEVTATDLAFKPDVEAWARRLGHTIIAFEEPRSPDCNIRKAVIRLGKKR